uniref:DRY_EERY domain-containing protein n=1 Tax=Taenia asiatica TaxID=60517 RepID=A0A0R3VZG9_TAEAS
LSSIRRGSLDFFSTRRSWKRLVQKMITRNRGKSKSVVEVLGLAKKNKRRVSRESDSAATSAALLPLTHEGTATEAKEEASRSCDGGSSFGITPDSVDCYRCAQEAEGLNSVETIPAKWSFSPDRLGVLTIDPPAFPKCEDGLGALNEAPGHDWLPLKGVHSFRVYDEVLREILEEISAVGGVFLSRRQFLQSRLRRNESKEKEEDAVYAFEETRLQRLFGKMSDDLETINGELDKDEAFLASYGLVRPGVTRALRKRRLEKCKQTKHEAMGRLRPNPRPRRFSDMVNPSVEVAERLTGISRNTKRVRDRNARAAAKKLAQAKS